MDKLILESVPEDIDEDYLNLFIMNCLGIVEDDFSITRSNDKALLVLSREYSLAGKSHISVQHCVHAVYPISRLKVYADCDPNYLILLSKYYSPKPKAFNFCRT